MKQHGFTILEIMVVIGIIVLLSLISVPLFREQQMSTELKANARAILADLRLAQQRTVAEQTTYLVKLYDSPSRYQLIRRESGDAVVKDRSLTNSITWQDMGGFTNNEVVFTSNGAVVQSGTIVLKNNYNHTTIIEVKPSGYVRVN
ncbi:MAG: GspH/FimT family pseudopilin [Patescibacteria group bacterium]